MKIIAYLIMLIGLAIFTMGLLTILKEMYGWVAIYCISGATIYLAGRLSLRQEVKKTSEVAESTEEISE